MTLQEAKDQLNYKETEQYIVDKFTDKLAVTMTDFSTYKFRCSSLGALMTNQQGKKDTKTLDELSETAKGELIKVYVKEVYGREKDISNKYTEKGLAVEEDAISLLSLVKGKYLLKNAQRYTNDYVTGEPDVIKPLYDTKSCWDIHTFFAAKTKKLDKDYFWQIQGYCDLIGASEGTVVFCLIDTPLELINDEKRRLFYGGSYISQESPDYLEVCEQLEKEMTFGDIPKEERIHEVKVSYDTELIEKVYERITLCREWLNDFAKKNQPKLITV